MTQPLVPMEQIGIRRTGSHKGGIPQKHILDERGRRLMLATYDGKTETIDMLAKELQVPRVKIKNWAGQLGLSRRKEPRWTEQEIAYVERNISKKSLKDIASHLGRTQTAVKLKAKRLGVNKCGQEGYTLRALELGLGRDHKAIERWIERGWLHGRRRHTERSTHDVWYFSDADIQRLVRAHPEEIDPRRVDWLWFVDVIMGGYNGIGELAS